jgi:hypothetical protein
MFRGKNPVGFVIYEILQGALGFAIGRFVFNLTPFESLAFPAGALLALLGFGIVMSGFSKAVSASLLAVFLAGGLAVALRLFGVFGGLLYGLTLLNGVALGRRNFAESAESSSLFGNALLFASLLAVARAAIQYYLLESNYASLGVVITHPYTFVALFAGIFLPGIYWLLERDRPVPVFVTMILLGLVLPIVMGVFLHVRPMAGYLLGIGVSSFMAGVLFTGSEGLGLVTYLNLGAVSLGLPLFKELSDLSRAIRLEILGGLLVLVVIFFLLFRLFQGNKPQTAT